MVPVRIWLSTGLKVHAETRIESAVSQLCTKISWINTPSFKVRLFVRSFAHSNEALLFSTVCRHAHAHAHVDVDVDVHHVRRCCYQLTHVYTHTQTRTHTHSHKHKHTFCLSWVRTTLAVISC